MARVNIQERMEKAIGALQRSCWGPYGIDIERECKDQWSRDYAIIVVHIVEPEDDDLRAAMAVDSIQAHLLERAAECFGRSAVAVRKRGGVPRGKSRLVVQMHPLTQLGVEIEAYRSKVAASAS